jgi:hypothetical protein
MQSCKTRPNGRSTDISLTPHTTSVRRCGLRPAICIVNFGTAAAISTRYSTTFKIAVLKLAEPTDALRSVFDPPKPLNELQTKLPPAGFATQAQLLSYLGPPPPGYEWHHIIEQNGQFRPDLTSPEGIATWIQNTDNMVLVSVIKHYCVSGLMSTTYDDLGGPIAFRGQGT